MQNMIENFIIAIIAGLVAAIYLYPELKKKTISFKEFMQGFIIYSILFAIIGFIVAFFMGVFMRVV